MIAKKIYVSLFQNFNDKNYLNVYFQVYLKNLISFGKEIILQ